MTRVSMISMMAPTSARRGLTARKQHCGTGVAQIVGEDRGGIGARERIDRFAHRIVFVRTHGAFAQPEHIAFLIVQGNGMRARRLDGRTHFLTDGIEIDERTFRFTEGFALLHTSATAEIGLHIYRTGALLDVMVFAKTPGMRPRRRRLEKSRRVARMTYHRQSLRHSGETLRTMSPTEQTRQFRYYDFVMAAYVCVLLCSNLIGPAKETSIHMPGVGFTLTFLAGVLFFPISYIFGDILTEVYGYARDRRVVWAGFGRLAFASLMAAVVVHLPPSENSRGTQPAVEAIFGNTPRIVAASITAFLCGTFVNSYVLAKMKIWTEGRWLWTRIVGSTLCGELVDSVIFYFVAFYGRMPGSAPGGDHVHAVRVEKRMGNRRRAAHLSRGRVLEEGRAARTTTTSARISRPSRCRPEACHATPAHTRPDRSIRRRFATIRHRPRSRRPEFTA